MHRVTKTKTKTKTKNLVCSDCGLMILGSQRPCEDAGPPQQWKVMSKQDPGEKKKKTRMKLTVFLMLGFLCYTCYFQCSWDTAGREGSRNPGS